MTKLDYSTWKEFNLSNIFHMQNTKSIIQKDIVPNSGKIPYVTSQFPNNGVSTYISCPLEWLESGNCIMIGGKTLSFSYQAKPFCSNDSHNITLTLKDSANATETHYLFLITALRASLHSRYSWDDSISMKRIKKETFFLPADSNGKPDWDYMDDHMRQVLQKSVISLHHISKIDYSKKSLDISHWKKFHLYDDSLFSIDMGTKLDRVKMTETHPSVNFVGRANTNNGITACVDAIEHLPPYSAGLLTLSLGGEYLGSCFVQPKPFYTSQNVVVLIPTWEMPFEVKLFISTMIFRESRIYYKAFVDELNRHLRTDFSFYLPVTSSGSPDWAFMSNYMRNILSSTRHSIDELTRF